MNEEHIFHEALARSCPKERAAYLEKACAGSAALLASVQALLRASAGATGFLERPAADPVATVDDPIMEGPGTVIGPYKLLEQIGEGGFGVVFMAEQQHPVRRKVALKVLKPGMDTRQVIARFEAERQALALMDHPNIARVLEAGETASGRPYFVMELVRGPSMTDYCDHHSLPVRERLELFIDVCQAVQHAHQKGIIHRDIKPSNVLVTLHDGKPVVKVIDFGIAKAMGQQLTDKTLFTNFAQMIGTPLYMSPEQAELSGLDIDTRSDIYSLGVLLYELLTGTTPFDKDRLRQAGFDEIRRIIREEEPPKPSTRMSTLDQAATTASTHRKSDPRKLSRLFRGELDWIVMKALEKDRNHRYETASAFAADVQRYLNDEAVHACPPSAIYRFRKFARRNKTGLAVAGPILLFIVLLGGAFGWAARDRAGRRDLGERRAQGALQEAGRLLEEEKWPEALSFVGQAEAVLANSGGGEDLLGQAGRLRQDLEMAQSLEEARLKITATEGRHFDHFDWQPCDAAYAEAFEKYQLDVDGLDPQEAAKRVRASPIRRQLTAALDHWATIRKELNAQGWQNRLAIARAADPDRWRNRLRDALEGKDDRALGEVLQSASPEKWPAATLVMVAMLTERTASAERAVALLRRGQQQHPSDFWINHSLGFIHISMRPPRLEDAVHYFGIAVALRPHNLGAHTNLGIALADQGKLDEAIGEFHKAIELGPKFAEAHTNLGTALGRQGKRDEAIAEHHKAIELDPKLAMAHNNLGNTLSRQGKVDEAIAEFHKAIDLDPKDPWAHNSLGAALDDQGKLDEAIAEYRQAIAINPKLAMAHYNLGTVLGRQGKLDEAIAEFHKAIDLDPKNADFRCNLAHVLRGQGRFAESLDAYKRGHALGSKRPDWTQPSAEWVRQVEQLVALDTKLAKVRKGEAEPADAAERMALADLCQRHKKLYLVAVGWYAEAFVAQPMLADDLNAGHRYNAACAAALAGCGQGEDAAKLDEKERARLRRQALDWLRADLTAWGQLLDKAPDKARAAVQGTMRHWQQDPDFTGLRGDALAKLPEAERQPWKQLWADVEQTLKKANDKDTKDMKTKPPDK